MKVVIQAILIFFLALTLKSQPLEDVSYVQKEFENQLAILHSKPQNDVFKIEEYLRKIEKNTLVFNELVRCYYEIDINWKSEKKPEAISYAESIYESLTTHELTYPLSIEHIFIKAKIAELLAEKYQSIYQLELSSKWYFMAGETYQKVGLWKKSVECNYTGSTFRYDGIRNDLVMKIVMSNIEILKSKSGGPESLDKKIKHHYNLLGLIYKRLKQYDSALIAYDHALRLAENLEDEFWIALINGNIGAVLKEMKQYDKAIPKLEFDIFYSKKHKEWESAINGAISLAQIYFELENLPLMKVYLDSANHFVDEYHIVSRRPYLYYEYFKYYQQKGDFENALLFLEKHIFEKDSLKSFMNSNELTELKMKYDLEMGKTELEFLKKENILKENQFKQSLIVNVSLFILLFILLIVGRVLFLTLKKVKSLNLRLDTKVKERTLDLEQKNQLLEDYLYHSSHDIRRPITTLLGLFNLGIMSRNLEEKDYYFTLGNKVCAQMDSMLLKIYYLYLTQNQIDLERTSIIETIRECLSINKSLIANNSMNVSLSSNIQEKIKITSNPELLKAVLGFLIENSCQFIDKSKSSNELRIKIDQIGPQIIIILEDNGIGIPDHLQSQLFEPFKKLNESANGNGLGLFLSKLIMEKLGGDIILNSKHGIGTKITLILPNEEY